MTSIGDSINDEFYSYGISSTLGKQSFPMHGKIHDFSIVANSIKAQIIIEICYK